MARFDGDCDWPITVGAGKVAEVDADWFVYGIEFGLDDRDGAEEKISDEGEDGGAAGGDQVGGEEFVEFGKGIVDAEGGGEFVGVVGKDFAKVVGLPGKLRAGVLFAEAKTRVAGQLAALATRGSEVATIGSSDMGCGWVCH